MNTTRYFRVNVNEYIGDCLLSYELLIHYLDYHGIKADNPNIALIIEGKDIEIDGKTMKFIEDKKEKIK